MQTVPPGITTRRSFDATAADTAAAVGNVGVEVVATVTMILWVEATCGSLITPYFEDGEASVGFRVALDHTGPAFAGRPVEVSAEVTAVRGHKVTFAVRLEQGGHEVMAGEHVRAIVNLDRLLGGQAQARDVVERPAITFWFDVHSPWSYLVSTRIGALARKHHATVIWKPLHLANLMDQVDGMRPMEQSFARVVWYEQDVIDRMGQHGLAYDPHPDYPLRPSRALRACAYAAEQGRADAFVQAVMRGYWAEKRDISDLNVLQAMADQSDLGPRPIAEIAEDLLYKKAIADNTAEAVTSGLFGVPSMHFDGKLFFGADHLDLLESALARWKS
jgi:2-hydroxychromene-2-carboxylate isomerase/predicted thioesterase